MQGWNAGGNEINETMIDNMQKLFCVFVTFFAVTISMSAQSLIVNGRVEDQKGEPLVGVAVYEDGRTSEEL